MAQTAQRPGRGRHRERRCAGGRCARPCSGLMLVCSTITLPGRGAGVATPASRARDEGPAVEKEIEIAARLRLCASRTPAGRITAAASSAAIARGALRSVFARSNATGLAKSPIASLGGRSSTIRSSGDLRAELLARRGRHGRRERLSRGASMGAQYKAGASAASRSAPHGRTEALESAPWVSPSSAPSPFTPPRPTRSTRSRASSELLSWLCEGALVGLRPGGNWAVGFTDERGVTEATVLGKIAEFERGRGSSSETSPTSRAPGSALTGIRMELTFAESEGGCVVTVEQDVPDAGPAYDAVPWRGGVGLGVQPRGPEEVPRRAPPAADRSSRPACRRIRKRENVAEAVETANLRSLRRRGLGPRVGRRARRARTPASAGPRPSPAPGSTRPASRSVTATARSRTSRTTP